MEGVHLRSASRTSVGLSGHRFPIRFTAVRFLESANKYPNEKAQNLSLLADHHSSLILQVEWDRRRTQRVLRRNGIADACQEGVPLLDSP